MSVALPGNEGVGPAPGRGTFDIRPLLAAQAPESARLHREVLGTEFLARAGESFLCLYHRAWCESPAGLALAAVSPKGELVGVLLGSLEPAAHYRFMARRYGLGLASRLLRQAAAHPRFAKELIATRAFRYARGALRTLARPRGPKATAAPQGRATAAPQGREGEITHLMVAQGARGAGVGKGLVQEALRAAAAAGLDRVVLVTPPELASTGFYLHLGWQPDGEVTSRSGERFVRYKWPLGTQNFTRA